MGSAAPFTFGIPLMPRAAARDWRRVEALLGLTLKSVRAQTDPAFRVVIAGHDRPRCIPDDERFGFLQRDWPVGPPGSRNCDGGRKKYAIREHVLEESGGLLMFLDADDWVDVRLVEASRRALGPEHAGGVITSGFAIDFGSLRAAPLPDRRFFAGGFHRLCGSSVVARMRPDEADPFRRDPWSAITSHHRWIEAAHGRGADVAELPVCGGYLINTSENHSELHGPFADWRRDFAEAVERQGRPLSAALALRFGLRLAEIRRTSERLRPGERSWPPAGSLSWAAKPSLPGPS
jgi:hypothetical protein